MRKVLKSHDEVAHVWAQQTQSEGRASRMFFEGEKIYSYGKHFCIARILPSGTVVYGTHTYSSSTGKHQSVVRSAVSHRRMVYCRDPDAFAWKNREAVLYSIKSKLEHAKAKGVRELTRLESRLSARLAAEQFNTYLQALPAKERAGAKAFDLRQYELSAQEAERLIALREEKQTKRDARDAAFAARIKLQRERAAEREKENVEKWRTGEFSGSLYNVPTMLRLSRDGENVETSRGADIPVSHAKRLWPMIENVRAVGQPLLRDVRLGHYTLSSIAANGDIVVGCHNIAYEEIERIAAALGLLEANAA